METNKITWVCKRNCNVTNHLLMKKSRNLKNEVCACGCKCRCEIYEYLDKRYVFNRALKENTDAVSLIWLGKSFHISGPWCLIVLCAKIILGFVKWMSEEWRVGYEWMSLLYTKIFWKDVGIEFVENLYIKMAVWKVWMSFIFNVLKFRKIGSVCAK